MQTFLAFILVFGIIVIVHEFGHFYFAKRAGILVREFAIGMGPKLFQTHKNETTYTIRVLPLGGYVLMAGYEEEEDLRLGMPAILRLDENNRVSEIDISDESVQVDGVPIDVLDYDFEQKLYIQGSIGGDMENIETYSVNEDAVVITEEGTKHQIAPAHRQVQNASLMNRILTNFGGPLSNFILSIVTFMLLAFMRGGVPSAAPILGDIQPDSPAAESVLASGDRVLSIDGLEVSTWTEMVMLVQQNPENELTFEVEKPSGEIVTENIVPNTAQTAEGEEYGRIGVQVFMEDSFINKIAFGFTETWASIRSIFLSIILLITGRLGLDNLGGPIAIFSITGEVTRVGGFMGIINFIAWLSANLGLMNLLPIPALDGGKLVLNLVEAIRGKPITPEKEGLINVIGAVLLLILMVFVTWNDIQRYFFN